MNKKDVEEVTCWYRVDPVKGRPFNHIDSSGHIEQKSPVPISDEQKKIWSNTKREKEFCYGIWREGVLVILTRDEFLKSIKYTLRNRI